jgi:hypothetical protein
MQTIERTLEEIKNVIVSRIDRIIDIACQENNIRAKNFSNYSSSEFANRIKVYCLARVEL